MSLIQLPMADIILKYNLVYLQPNKSVEKVQQDALITSAPPKTPATGQQMSQETVFGCYPAQWFNLHDQLLLVTSTVILQGHSKT